MRISDWSSDVCSSDLGIMFHSVNCGDHYAYVDRSIHQLHYLKYSDRQWRFWDNAFLYQNRLRAHCFVDSAAERGFDIELNTAKARPERLRQLSGVPVHPQFADVPPRSEEHTSELPVTNAHL